ncbi:hypothetical protein GCM10010324_17090 [Streptomyces hiroshimensis]|uniref:Uncharacterized protein n=1 Tax=Streptomyces hiroshimensis TaxID=66424 RepID=A0ABQ2Y7N4_9ACTN|nr:hypothetical protein GCM10010324_17090 [Streptomyces hiroshimensis]
MSLMNDEFSACVCCSCEAVRMSVENGVVAGASKADLRVTEGRAWRREAILAT